MNTPHLIPALHVIESGLFPHHVAARGPAIETTNPADVGSSGSGTTAITPSLELLMAMRAAAAQALANRSALSPANQPVEVGQIRWIAPAMEAAIAWPVALLIASLANGLAQGWIVSSETLYASRDDWLLQSEDQDHPPDPRCAMVQLWNMVEVPQAQLQGVAGTLTSTAFLKLSKVAARLAASPAELQSTEVQPGRFGLHELIGDDHLHQRLAYVCGTSLGSLESGDSRLYYRYLYMLFAQQLQRSSRVGRAFAAHSDAHSAAARPHELGARTAEAANTPFWRLPGTWQGAGVVAALVLAVVAPILLWQSDTASIERGVGPEPAPSSNFGQPERFTIVDIHFSTDAPVGSVSALLRQVGGRIVAGPTETGAWRASIRNDQIDAARALLSNSALVVTFDNARQ